MKTKAREAQTQATGKRKIEVELLDLYEACLGNAEDLVTEADLLLSNGHVARAYALGFTAYEEIGKSQLVADKFNDVVSGAEFAEAFRSHTLKAAYVARHVTLPSGTVVYDRAAVKSHYQLRSDALYVGLETGNSPRRPADAVSRDAAESVIEAVRQELESIRYAEWLNQRIGTKGLFK